MPGKLARRAEADLDEVTDAVLTASRALVAVAARSLAAAEEDVSLAQYRVLVLLASRGPQRVAEVAEALAVVPSTATRVVDRLVRKRLVAAVRPQDRETLVAALRAFADAAGELPDSDWALGWGA